MAKACSNLGCKQPSTSRCEACKSASYCSQACQKKDWPSHRPGCKLKQANASSTPTDIQCVKIYGMPCRYEAATLPSTHEIFNGRPLPVTVSFKYPLVMARLVEDLPRGPATDNQHATWLQIDPVSGFAPHQWQGGIGDVFVANADGTALSVETLGAITDYISDILDAFVESNSESIVRRFYDRKRLDGYIKNHLQMRAGYRATKP